ncbi:hypothetical protein FB45DRAFT_1063130 [Roridomyces roridus]|uniref:F-box domain-containing protein n=1 Tax=Roridomyces roridus TaxID=1738132 RepID=A0AAD7FGB0_9AGAR|nr:hypothetical protein FB45DRAFT_1063130 [Roridomyces roridus]
MCLSASNAHLPPGPLVHKLAMHCALFIAEIAELVCSHLNITEFSPSSCRDTPSDSENVNEDRRALVALASTCKALLEPALDAIWKAQDSIVPWLACLPEDLFNMRPALATEEDPLLLERPFAIDDWRPSDLNAARVEILTFEYDARFQEIFKALSIAFPFGSLFPRLRSLSWTSESNCEEDFIHVRVLLTPTLLSIAVSYMPTVINCSIRSTLTRSCPRLVHVSVQIPDRSHSIGLDEPSLASNSQFAQSLRRIKSLSVPTVSRAAILHIGRLPDLAFLCMDNLLGTELPYVHNGEPRTFFPALRVLHVHRLDIETAIQLIQMGSKFQMESLDFRWNEALSRREMEEFYNLLAEFCSHTALVNLRFGLIQDPAIPSLEFVINTRLLQILFCFCNLTSVSLTSPYTFDIDDFTLMDAARAWPRLERLELDTLSHHPRQRHKLTLQSLYAFALYCPRLRVLQIQVDATETCTMACQLPQYPPPHNQLTKLYITHSDISKSAVNAIADVISTLFPDLRAVTFPCCMFDEEFQRRAELWEQVEGLLPELAGARE